jgi:hypothetical protein
MVFTLVDYKDSSNGRIKDYGEDQFRQAQSKDYFLRINIMYLTLRIGVWKILATLS